jgi:GNAT superfamily N-acetyltransferase
MTTAPTVRPLAQADYVAWRPLWDGYNAFYGRHGETALAEHITQTAWQRFFDPNEPVFALVAEDQCRVVGLAHYLFHRSMTRVEHICYLSDLFTLPSLRGRGIGRSLIQGVYAQAKSAGATRVYWQTHETNAAGRLLYDKVAKHLGFIVYSSDV